jgi:RHS repeat-associated protein
MFVLNSLQGLQVSANTKLRHMFMMGSYGYDAWPPMHMSATAASLRRFSYYRARYYDPQARQFISEDPIGLDGGINLYAYVGNNPLKLVDPSGTDSFTADQIIDYWGSSLLNEEQGSPRGNPPAVPKTSAQPAAQPASIEQHFEEPPKSEKGYWERVIENFKITNDAIPGLLAPPFSGAIISGKVAANTGGISLFRWTLSGFSGATLTGVAHTSLETGIIAAHGALVSYGIASIAWEAGVFLGSMINAAF